MITSRRLRLAGHVARICVLIERKCVCMYVYTVLPTVYAYSFIYCINLTPRKATLEWIFKK